MSASLKWRRQTPEQVGSYLSRVLAWLVGGAAGIFLGSIVVVAYTMSYRQRNHAEFLNGFCLPPDAPVSLAVGIASAPLILGALGAAFVVAIQFASARRSKS
jgi:hypothetical protein